MTTRIPWGGLPGDVREAVGARLGGPVTAVDAGFGNNCTAAAVVQTDTTRVFVKVQEDGDGEHVAVPWWPRRAGGEVAWGRIDQLDEEERISPFLPACAPRVLWRLRVDTWDVLAFEPVEGRYARFYEDDDVSATLAALTELAACPAPTIDLPTAADVWSEVDDAVKPLLEGDRLLHGDIAGLNVMIEATGRARLVDWAWPFRGPAWVDAVVWGMRLVAEGERTPEKAAEWVARLPGFTSAPRAGVHAIAQAEADRWREVAAAEGGECVALAEPAEAWARFWTL